MKKLILLIISFYKNISFVFPSSCRFWPSCSQYASEAIEKYGFWVGLLKFLKRILNCHPFSSGGYDPP